jgi:hypothetical protein
MVSVDWGDGTSSQKQVAVDAGLGAWPHTYAQPDNYTVTVTMEYGWLQTAHHDSNVSIAWITPTSLLLKPPAADGPRGVFLSKSGPPLTWQLLRAIDA